MAPKLTDRTEGVLEGTSTKLVNCKQVALLLNRIKNQELIEFIREDDVKLFEGKTIMGDRRGGYIQAKERHKLEGKEKKKAPGARASTPKALEI